MNFFGPNEKHGGQAGAVVGQTQEQVRRRRVGVRRGIEGQNSLGSTVKGTPMCTGPGYLVVRTQVRA